MAKADTSPFYKPSKNRGVVPCEQWAYFVVHELKGCTVRLLGPPVRSPGGRYAIHCIDRSDGKVKVLEGPHDLFVQFGVYAQHTGRNPSGPDAPDFRIALTVRPFCYFVTPMNVKTLTYQEQLDMTSHALNLGKLYKTGADLHIVEVAARLGVWPKPVWPTKFQEKANASDPERLAAEGVVIRFPSESDCR